MKAKIGVQFVLTNRTPVGLFGLNKKLPKFIVITVTKEMESATGEFTNKTYKNKSYLAKGSDGYVYAYNYPTVNEGYGSTAWTRYMPDEEFVKLPEEEKDKLIDDYLWSDVTNYDCPAEPKFVSKYKDIIAYCDKHQKLYYKRNECLYCNHNFKNKHELNMQDHAWIGWY